MFLARVGGDLVEGVWYDYWCMPQDTRTPEERQKRLKPDPRSPAERLRFKWMLQNVNLLYLGMRVLVLMDISYLSRFWTQFEAWLSLQAGGAAGLGPAAEVRRRVTIRCVDACLFFRN